MSARSGDEPAGTVARVTELPDCDIHLRLFGVTTPAEYDAAAVNLPGQPWAYMCGRCFPRFGPGRLGEGIGQRLRLTDGEEG